MLKTRKIKNAINYCKHHQYTLRELLDTFDLNNYDYAFVGGFVKWVLDKHFDINGPRDFDIIVDMKTRDLESIIKAYKFNYTKNDFGGFKIQAHPWDTFNKTIDIWTLETHKPFIPFENAYNISRNFKNLSKTAFISLDSAVYWVNKNKLYCKDCLYSLKTKAIFFTDNLCVWCKDLENKYILVAKLIKYNLEGYILDGSCWTLIKNYFTKHTEKSIVKYLDKHYSGVLDWKNFIDEKILPKVI